MIYTGIGSRESPSPILDIMTELGMLLAMQKWCLRSGGARGADKAFEQGCDFSGGFKEIYLPIQERPSVITDEALRLAEVVWKTRDRVEDWAILEPYTKLIMARNCLQVLGNDVKTPTDLIICWTPGGDEAGGTGQALALARMINNSDDYDFVIPILNLANEIDRQYINAVLKGEDLWEFTNHMKGELKHAKVNPKRNSKSYLGYT